MLLKFWPQKTNLSFMNLRLIGAVVSSVLIAASVFFLSTRGLNFGVDFAVEAVLALAVDVVSGLELAM